MFTLWYLWGLYNGRYKKVCDKELLQWLEDNTEKLSDPSYRSLLKKCLTKNTYSRLKNRQTVNGVTLKDVIYSGITNPSCGIGAYAADPDAYYVFNELFDPIIEIYHSGFKYHHKTPKKDYGNLDKVFDLDLTGQYINSIKIRGNRCLDGYLFTPKLCKEHFCEVEEKISNFLKGLSGELYGHYYSLSNITEEIQRRLKFQNFLFESNNKILSDANCYKYWPAGRGIFFNMKNTLLVWINEEDHIRLVSMQKGSDLRSVYERYITIMDLLEGRFCFTSDDRLGYLNFSIMNLGIAMRISVQITLPCLSSTPTTKDKLRQFCKDKDLCIKPVEDMKDTYDIFSRRSLGLTEFQCVEQFQCAMLELIRLERTCSFMSPEEKYEILVPKAPCAKKSKEATSEVRLTGSKIKSTATSDSRLTGSKIKSTATSDSRLTGSRTKSMSTSDQRLSGSKIRP